VSLVAWISRPWPWYVAGPLIGLMVPALLLVGNQSFGISSNLRHLCAAVLPSKWEYFRYDWRGVGAWNLAFAAGIVAGGAVAGHFLLTSDVVAIAPSTREALARLGMTDFHTLVPRELFSWSALASWRGLVAMLGGGFLIGFGTAYAGGCTSGHAISGLANLQLPSLIAVLGFFAGGLASTYWVVPWLLGAAR
jgi:Predicted transporter component